MDAFELTRPILANGGRLATTERRRIASTTTSASARRYVNQLPLGSWAGPAFTGTRWNAGAAAREVERALVRVAAASGVAVGVDDTPSDIARRLVRCRVIVTPAADGAVALLQLLAEGDRHGDAAKLAERLIGYLDHRATSRSGRAQSGMPR
jgi:hypothetical protein